MKSFYDIWKESDEWDNILLLIKKWRSEGMLLDDIAERLGISRAVLYDYQKKYKDFSDALKVGKEIIDAKVEESLIQECLGYNYEETTTTTTAIIDKETGQVTNLQRVESKTTKKRTRPSVTAIAYYLNNRAPKKWKNKVVVDTDDYNGILPKLIEAMKSANDKNKSVAE